MGYYEQLTHLPPPPSHTHTQCRIYALVNRVSTGSDNGLATPFSERMLGYCLLDPKEQIAVIFFTIQNFLFTKLHLKMSSAKWRPFCPGGDEFIFYANGITVFTNAFTVVMVLLGIDTT